ncbi:hypothetical protein HK101_006340 [Irineochytrium annulatum]|nr:hypothetical protein HK101_006340 [Irineochytrium annulatum]
MSAVNIFATGETTSLQSSSTGVLLTTNIPPNTVHVANTLFAALHIISPNPNIYNPFPAKCGSSLISIAGTDSKGYTMTANLPAPPSSLIGDYIFTTVFVDSPDATSCNNFIFNSDSSFDDIEKCMNFDGRVWSPMSCSAIVVVTADVTATMPATVPAKGPTTAAASATITEAAPPFAGPSSAFVTTSKSISGATGSSKFSLAVVVAAALLTLF